MRGRGREPVRSGHCCGSGRRRRRRLSVRLAALSALGEILEAAAAPVPDRRGELQCLGGLALGGSGPGVPGLSHHESTDRRGTAMGAGASAGKLRQTRADSEGPCLAQLPPVHTVPHRLHWHSVTRCPVAPGHRPAAMKLRTHFT